MKRSLQRHPAGSPGRKAGSNTMGHGAGLAWFSMGVLCPLLVSVLICPGRASASGRFLTTHVRKGEKADAIALRVYGNKNAAPLVRAVAGMKPLTRKRLRAQMLLRLPIAWNYRIRHGDTWAQIGRDYLSAGFRGRLLAMVNGKNPTQRPPVGHVIRIPATLWYKPSRTIPLRRLVRWLSPALSATERKLLSERIVMFNKLSGKRLRRNKTILVPLFSLHAKQGLVANDLPIPDPKAARRLNQTHRAAKALLADGHYEQAAALCLKNISLAHLAPRQGARVYKDLAHAFVAEGWTTLAKTMASMALSLDPKVPLDPIQDSPKILRLFGVKAGSDVSAGR